nr:hypothetical protein [Tanacetum cinerariifolium]
PSRIPVEDSDPLIEEIDLFLASDGSIPPDISKKIYSNPLFVEEIISIKIDSHHFTAESKLIESMINQDSSIISSSSSKIDYLLDEFAGELILLKSIQSGIDKADSWSENIQQKKEEKEKKIAEEQAAKARYWKISICYDDDEDYTIAITPREPDNSLSMGDEHLDTIPTTESDEFIKSSVENLVPNP